MFTYKKTERQNIIDLTTEHGTLMTGPRDDLWEGSYIPSFTAYAIEYQDKAVGFFSLNEEQELTQFFLQAKHACYAEDVFADVLEKFYITRAYVDSVDPYYCMLATTKAQNIDVFFYMFEGFFSQELPLRQDVTTRLAEEKDLDALLQLELSWFKKYDAPTVERTTQRLKTWIDKKATHIFFKDETLMARGQVRIHEHNTSVAHVGMLVHDDYRKQGIGAYVMSHLKNSALAMGVRPVCAARKSNTGSLQTIKKGGFTPVGRIYLMDF